MSVLTEDQTEKVYEADLLTVHDGDTVDMRVFLGMGMSIKARIRFVGIDAPEIYGVSKQSQEFIEGLKAKMLVKEWFDKEPAPYYVRAEHKGVYGRWLGEIWRTIGEISLNDYLINNYLKSDYWSKYSQETLIREWEKDKDWKRWAEYDFARYGARKYSVPAFGRYRSGHYDQSKYKTKFDIAKYGYYYSSSYGDCRYN